MDRCVILLVICSYVSLASALSCLPCDRSNCVNVTCSGTVVSDSCGCCPACSKQRSERCGGPWDIYGICDPEKDLICYKFVRPDELAFNLAGTCQPNGTQNRCSFPHMFTECASACPSNCEEPDPEVCIEVCITDQCVCGEGFIRQSRSNDTCIPREQCERLRPRECELPKILSSCATACPATCGNPYPFICTKNCDLDPCVCPSGYLMRSMTDRRCMRAFECEDFSFCDKTCPPILLSSSPRELNKAWTCELDNWKCNTYKWKREMERWWSDSCSSDVNELMKMWNGLSDCDPNFEVRCVEPDMAENDVDAFGCSLSRCSDGRYKDARQLLEMWKRNYNAYLNYMKVYKRVGKMCDSVF